MKNGYSLGVLVFFSRGRDAHDHGRENLALCYVFAGSRFGRDSDGE